MPWRRARRPDGATSRRIAPDSPAVVRVLPFGAQPKDTCNGLQSSGTVISIGGSNGSFLARLALELSFSFPPTSAIRSTGLNVRSAPMSVVAVRCGCSRKRTFGTARNSRLSERPGSSMKSASCTFQKICPKPRLCPKTLLGLSSAPYQQLRHEATSGPNRAARRPEGCVRFLPSDAPNLPVSFRPAPAIWAPGPNVRSAFENRGWLSG